MDDLLEDGIADLSKSTGHLKQICCAGVVYPLS